MNKSAGSRSPVNTSEAACYSLRHLVLYALRLGALGFGGPVALVGFMRRDLVERRRWITEAEYAEGLALAQLAPGPLAAQLMMYLGYVHHRIREAALVGLAFVAPSFLMVVALGWAYVRFGGLPWIHLVFYGVGANVIGIIAASAYKLTRRTVGQDRLLWVIYLVLAVTTIITASEQILLVMIAGVVVWLVKAPLSLRPSWPQPLLRSLRLPRCRRRCGHCSSSSSRQALSYLAVVWRSCHSYTGASCASTTGSRISSSSMRSRLRCLPPALS